MLNKSKSFFLWMLVLLSINQQKALAQVICIDSIPVSKLCLTSQLYFNLDTIRNFKAKFPKPITKRIHRKGYTENIRKYDIPTTTSYFKIKYCLDTVCNSNDSTTIISYNKFIKNEDGTITLPDVGYPLSLLPNTDTLQSIKALLSFEGDTRVCIIPIRCYNTLFARNTIWHKYRYSLQVEALFIINQLYYAHTKEGWAYHSPYPILKAMIKEDGYDIILTESIDGDSIKMAYKAYRNWLAKIESLNISLEEARKKNIHPLDGTNVFWYPSNR